MMKLTAVLVNGADGGFAACCAESLWLSLEFLRSFSNASMEGRGFNPAASSVSMSGFSP
jgi:hypothetical protein